MSHIYTKKAEKSLKKTIDQLELRTLSKMFQKIMFPQISAFFDNVFSKYQGGFWKGYSTL